MSENTCRHYQCFLYTGTAPEDRDKVRRNYCERAGEGCREREILDSVHPIIIGERK